MSIFRRANNLNNYLACQSRTFIDNPEGYAGSLVVRCARFPNKSQFSASEKVLDNPKWTSNVLGCEACNQCFDLLPITETPEDITTDTQVQIIIPKSEPLVVF
jgi:hypothetical protein